MTDKANSPHLLAHQIEAQYDVDPYDVDEDCYNEAQVERAWNELVTLFKRVAV